ncbi:unnamed protein product, partial [Ixodes hexagonus]
LPKFEGSFYASGEMYRSNFEVEDELKLKETCIFEEAYSEAGRKAALRVVRDKDVIVFLEDLYTKHRFVIHTSDGYTTCERAAEEDWDDKSHLVTVIRGPDKRKYTLLRDILKLQRKVKAKTRVVEVVRDMYCRVFDLDINDTQRYIRPVVTWTVNETVYVKDDGTIGTHTSTPKETPSRPPPGIKDLRTAMYTPRNGTLAVPWEVKYLIEVRKHETETMTNRIFNIDYISQPSVSELLEIPDGVYCPGNYYRRWLSRPVFSNIKVMRYSARVWNSKTKKFSLIQGWLDVYKRLFRLDYRPWLSKDGKPLTIIAVDTNTTKIPAYNRVYEISEEGTLCKAKQIDQLDFDPQMILKPSEISSLTTKTFFIGNTEDARLNYTKVVFKQGIPCHLWSIERKDWPPGPAYVESLWQWCFITKEFFADPSKAKSSQIVSLDITIVDLYYSRRQRNKVFEIGQTFSFFFYDVNTNMDKLSETEGFAPTACCEKNDTRNLRLYFNETTLSAILLRDPDFLFAAWSAVGQLGAIPNPRLHIINFKAVSDI